jgi:hypothetical protein
MVVGKSVDGGGVGVSEGVSEGTLSCDFDDGLAVFFDFPPLRMERAVALIEYAGVDIEFGPNRKSFVLYRSFRNLYFCCFETVRSMFLLICCFCFRLLRRFCRHVDIAFNFRISDLAECLIEIGKFSLIVD